MNPNYPPLFMKYLPEYTTAQRRRYSWVLAQFPWHSSEMVASDRWLLENTDKCPEYSTFFSSLYNFEDQVFSFRPSPRFETLRNLLGFAVCVDKTSEAGLYLFVLRPRTYTSQDYQKICSMVAAYRFLELVLIRSNIYHRLEPSTTHVIMELPQSPGGSGVLVNYELLANWPSIVYRLTDLVSSSERVPIPPRVLAHPVASLLNMLYVNRTRSGYLAVQENLILAALTVACMTTIPFQHGAIPDLPFSVPEVEILPGSEHMDYNAFQQQYNTLVGNRGADSTLNASASSRSPFQLALLISPLFLLIPRRLSSKSYHRRTVLHVAARLGPHKPSSVLRVETVIWDAIFLLAKGRHSIEEVMAELAVSLPGEVARLNIDNSDDARWFDLESRLSVIVDDSMGLSSNFPSSQPSASSSASSLLLPHEFTAATSATGAAQNPPFNSSNVGSQNLVNEDESSSLPTDTGLPEKPGVSTDYEADGTPREPLDVGSVPSSSIPSNDSTSPMANDEAATPSTGLDTEFDASSTLVSEHSTSQTNNDEEPVRYTLETRVSLSFLPEGLSPKKNSDEDATSPRNIGLDTVKSSTIRHESSLSAESGDDAPRFGPSASVNSGSSFTFLPSELSTPPHSCMHMDLDTRSDIIVREDIPSQPSSSIIHLDPPFASSSCLNSSPPSHGDFFSQYNNPPDHTSSQIPEKNVLSHRDSDGNYYYPGYLSHSASNLAQNMDESSEVSLNREDMFDISDDVPFVRLRTYSSRSSLDDHHNAFTQELAQRLNSLSAPDQSLQSQSAGVHISAHQMPFPRASTADITMNEDWTLDPASLVLLPNTPLNSSTCNSPSVFASSNSSSACVNPCLLSNRPPPPRVLHSSELEKIPSTAALHNNIPVSSSGSGSGRSVRISKGVNIKGAQLKRRELRSVSNVGSTIKKSAGFGDNSQSSRSSHRVSISTHKRALASKKLGDSDQSFRSVSGVSPQAVTSKKLGAANVDESDLESDTVTLVGSHRPFDCPAAPSPAGNFNRDSNMDVDTDEETGDSTPRQQAVKDATLSSLTNLLALDHRNLSPLSMLPSEYDSDEENRPQAAGGCIPEHEPIYDLVDLSLEDHGMKTSSSLRSHVKQDLKPLPTSHLHLSPSLLRTLGSSNNPIDVDEMLSIFEPVIARTHLREEEISLPAEFSPPIRGNKPYTIYSVDGEEITFTPSFHFEVEHERFSQFMTRAEEFYIDGRPLHLARPEDSVIACFTSDRWSEMTHQERQREMRSKSVIITNCSHEDLAFDECGLMQVGGMLSRQISINDHSIPLQGGCGPSTVSGRLQDVWDNRHENMKILNALDIPNPRGNREPQSHTTDLHAWELTAGHYGVSHTTPFSTEHFRWSLVGHQNATTNLHVDCDGLSTEISPTDGGKLWGFLRERASNPISSIDFFLQDSFRLNEVLDTSDYDFEIIALRPGDKLYMRPCQPHFVYGYKNSICRGGHYYFTGNLQHTLQGMVHTFVLHSFLTNTFHPVHPLLRKMVLLYHMSLLENLVPFTHPAFSHIPDVGCIEGLLDLLCACFLVILGNVLDFRTYQNPNQIPREEVKDPDDSDEDDPLLDLLQDHDVNAIPFYERADICYARGVALRLLAWIRHCAVIKDPAGQTVPDLCSRFFVQIACTIIKYKTKVGLTDPDLERGSEVALHLLMNQVFNVVNVDKDFLKTWHQQENIPMDSLVLAEWEKYSVQWVHDVQFNTMPLSPRTYFTNLGMTLFDKLFFAFQKERHTFEVEHVIPHIQGLSKHAESSNKKRKLS